MSWWNSSPFDEVVGNNKNDIDILYCRAINHSIYRKSYLRVIASWPRKPTTLFGNKRPD